ncbi:hypothetical protein [Rosistilla oblonga]
MPANWRPGTNTLLSVISSRSTGP